MIFIDPPTPIEKLSLSDLYALQERAYRKTDPMKVGDSDYDKSEKDKWYKIMGKVNVRIYEIEKQISEL